jgi:hypothetical protein
VAGGWGGDILTSTDPTGGANAWTITATDLPGCAPESTPCDTEQLDAGDDTGSCVIDTATATAGNSIGNVTLAADSQLLTWTHDGAQRQLQMH